MTKSKEEQDRFYMTVMSECFQLSDTSARDALIQLFAEHIKRASDLAMIDAVIAGFENEEQCVQFYERILRPVEESDEQLAVVLLRHVSLSAGTAEQDRPWVQDVVRWVPTEFRDSKLAACARAILADACYEQGRYADALEAFQPGILTPNRSGSDAVKEIENALVRYRANTLMPGGIDAESMYYSLCDKAAELKMDAVALHCYQKIAETEGLSLTDFEKSARSNVKRCQSGPGNEIWFWKGFLAAGEGDLTTAMTAYQRFLQEDSKSLLSARACYDVARAKMAVGQDAKQWIASAKALCPCAAVTELEQRLNAQASLVNPR